MSICWGLSLEKLAEFDIKRKRSVQSNISPLCIVPEYYWLTTSVTHHFFRNGVCFFVFVWVMSSRLTTIEAISTLRGQSLKLADFIYLGNIISSTESDVNIYLAKVRNATDRWLIIWKFDLSNKTIWDFFQVVVVSVLWYWCTTWMLAKCMEERQDGNYTRMQHAVFNKSWKQHSTKLYQ